MAANFGNEIMIDNDLRNLGQTNTTNKTWTVTLRPAEVQSRL